MVMSKETTFSNPVVKQGTLSAAFRLSCERFYFSVHFIKRLLRKHFLAEFRVVLSAGAQIHDEVGRIRYS
jgi:hypothetical protein